MIGPFEIIFCFLAFSLMWFFIFKIILMYEKSRLIKNINKSLEAQEGKEFIIEGRIVNLGNEEPGEKEPKKPVSKPTKKKK